MQAADLLSLLAPVNQGTAAPGAAFGHGRAATEGEPVDAFAQALAALMAATPPAQSPSPAQPAGEPNGDDDADTARRAQAAPPQSPHAPEATLAATASASAAAKSLQATAAPHAKADTVDRKAAAAGSDVATPSLEPAEADVPATSGAVRAEPSPPPVAERATPSEPVAMARAAPALPDQARAQEAPAPQPASPPPRADRAEQVAQGPQPLPAAAPLAAPSAPLATPSIPPSPAPPPVQAVATSTPPAVLASHAAKGDEPSPSPRAEGKAFGREKAESALAAHDLRGREFAPGQVKATASAQTPPDPFETPQDDAAVPEPAAPESSAAPESAVDDPPRTNPLAASDGARAVAHSMTEAARAAPHTVSGLATQITAKSKDGATRFEIQLDPHGLGTVDVRIEIGRRGEVTAALSFDNPQAAAELRSRAGELQAALEQAGFELSRGGLSFDFAGQRDGQAFAQQQTEPHRPAWRGAFTDIAAAADAPPPQLRHGAARGVDVTI